MHGSLLTSHTDVTGNPVSKLAILEIPDAFRSAPDTLRNADLLAELCNVIIVLPVLFDETPAQLTRFEAKGDPVPETKEHYSTFVQEKAPVYLDLPKVYSLTEAVKRHYSHVISWMGLGLGWGGKV